ncbi:MAG TPA: alginate lyase family protein [Draconibacterium sp.]|nr:alginate lyase family protein [Draconibacterium sp.]
MNSKQIVLLLLILGAVVKLATAQSFVHPGIHQSKEDLDYMKQQVLKGEQPWKNAFDSLVANTDLNFEVTAYTHVLRGPYGKPNIGGDDLSKGSKLAYQCALLWYITNEKKYAEKTIEILNKWSPVLWDFDYNDAKLLAAWTGHQLCNAAEILKTTDSGWKIEDQQNFSHMLMTVYYPLIRYYFPKANGNWDGAIIHTILAIAVYTDNREMFDNGINHFLYGPVNGSIFKYIWPSGQCQETLRDQGHVQLGLGEFAGAAQIAWTQGVDLFSLANNRIALGFEYTASFLLGEKPQSYGQISDRAKTLRDDYEVVYRHYVSQGITVPFTKIAADSVRSKATVSVLTASRAPSGKSIISKGKPEPSKIAWPVGAQEKSSIKIPENVIVVKPGESVQTALNKAAAQNGWVVLTSGLHKISEKLEIPSGITLSGEGVKTILFLDPEGGRDAVVNAESNMHNVVIRDLVIEGAANPDTGTDPNSRRSFRSSANRGGIMFLWQFEGEMKDITLQNITVRNCTYNGVFISGASNLKILDCDFSENGSDVVPGPKLQHNLLLSHCANFEVKDCRLVTSPFGCGVALTACKKGKIQGCEIARNAHYGCLITESEDISVFGCLVENNDKSGVMAEFLSKGSENIEVSENLIHYNNGFGIESYSTKNIKTQGNTLTGNLKPDQQKISNEKYIIMQ